VWGSSLDLTRTRALVDSLLASPAGVEPGEPAAARFTAGPSPFVSRTRLEWYAPDASGRRGRLAIYDLAGRRLRSLFDGPSSPGPTVAEWDGREDGGAMLPWRVPRTGRDDGDLTVNGSHAEGRLIASQPRRDYEERFAEAHAAPQGLRWLDATVFADRARDEFVGVDRRETYGASARIPLPRDLGSLYAGRSGPRLGSRPPDQERREIYRPQRGDAPHYFATTDFATNDWDPCLSRSQ